MDLEGKFILLRKLFEFEFVFFNGCEKQVCIVILSIILYNIFIICIYLYIYRPSIYAYYKESVLEVLFILKIRSGFITLEIGLYEKIIHLSKINLHRFIKQYQQRMFKNRDLCLIFFYVSIKSFRFFFFNFLLFTNDTHFCL